MAGRSREFMRSIAMKGGLAMKKRLETDPTYYKEISSMGGRVTAEKRKAEKAARLAGLSPEPQTDKPEPPVENVEKPVESVERKPARMDAVLERMRKAVEK